jgi:hypothetical protein
MSAEIEEETDMLESSTDSAEYITTCFIGWGKKSLEEVPSKRAGAYSSLHSGDRYRKSVGEVPGRLEAQRGLPGRSLDRSVFQQPSDTPEIMGSFYEDGWEISRNCLKVNVCYSLGPCVEFSVSHL